MNRSPSARGRMSKRKGSKFELRVAKMVKDHWDVELVRTPLSGGWGKMRTKGDLVHNPETHPSFPFYFECRNREGWTLDQVIQGTGQVAEWWMETRLVARDEGKIPLLVFTRNFNPIYVRVERLFLDSSQYPHMILWNGSVESVVCLFEDFLNWVGWEKLVKELI